MNYPQTRKSQNTKLVKILADALDAHVAALAEEAVSRSLAKQGDAGPQQADTSGAKKPRLRVASSTITCFTPEVFFERFSGDFQQLCNADEVGVQDGLVLLSEPCCYVTFPAFNFHRSIVCHSVTLRGAAARDVLASDGYHAGQPVNHCKSSQPFVDACRSALQRRSSILLSILAGSRMWTKRMPPSQPLASSLTTRAKVQLRRWQSISTGELNRLLQFGECSRTTKTSGTFGEGATPPVSSSIMANMHPEVALPMERAEIGNHVGRTKERIMFYTAEPIPPHSPLPPEYILADGHAPWVWAELDPDMASLCGLRSLLADPDAAEKAVEEGKLARASNDNEALGQLNPDDADVARGVRFLPNAAGYEMKLPDGVKTRWRYRIEPGQAAIATAECRMGDRDVPLPPQHALQPAAERVLRFFPPHTTLLFDESAKKLFATMRTQSSVLATLATDAYHCLFHVSCFC